MHKLNRWRSSIRPWNAWRLYSATTQSSESRWQGWETVIGIEAHAQIKSRAKLFSYGQNSSYEAHSNTHVDVFDAAFPGTLPKLNSASVDLAIRTAVALNGSIQERSFFDRKHYFYADLPSGYQITQHYVPFAKGGVVRLENCGKTVRIKQLQLEQDTAKTTTDVRSGRALIDLNRAGAGLMEIVSEPDMSSPEEAAEYVRTLQSLLVSVGSSDGSMDQGSLRCDVNVSVNRPGQPAGTRCEIKNLNSVKFMMVAIVSEILRQITLLENGIAITQETRGFDEDSQNTYHLRNKEDSPDYRYMPDPNLPALKVTKTYVDQVVKSMPELPAHTRSRLLGQGLNKRDVDFLMSIDATREIGFDGVLVPGAVALFDEMCRDRDPKTTVNWIINDLYVFLQANKLGFGSNPVSVKQLGELIDMVTDGRITVTSAKTLLKHMVSTKSTESPMSVGQELSLLVMKVDDSALKAMCQAAIDALPEEAELVRKGNMHILNKLMGYVIKSNKGRVDAQAVRNTLKGLLNS